ncbi:MAG: phenylalanine--tRNA ligase subunit beta [Sphingobacteriaceae bacterium]
MKISYNWLKQFIQTDHTAEELSFILTNIGLEVESLERIQTVPGGLEGLLIGYVKECTSHPNADRLKLTKVDIGAAEDLQIVCGANNIAAGQKVIVATAGTTVYPTTGEPFKINRSKIRGEYSEGMICAEDEIGLGTSHEGILVLDEHAPVGAPAKRYFEIEDDYCFEIGLTPNRADAASHLGVARDLAAYLNKPILMPNLEAFNSDSEHLVIPVTVEDQQACPRYSSLTISNITVAESPSWLKEKLNAIGLRPINNVVDATNYVLHELGQPLHAFDADTIHGGKVFVKKCTEGTPFTTLDGIARKLSSTDLMICHAEQAMCMAGVFGGIHSGIKSTTKNIFLESAWFNAVSIRKTAKRHGLKTDASFRYERGTDPEITITALKRAALLIKEIAGGHISSPISDIYPAPVRPFRVDLRYERVDRLIGKVISREEIKSILKNLGIHIESDTTQGLILNIPTYKVDVTREVDVIEEILRIHGYNQVEIPQQIRASLNYTEKPNKELIQNQISDLLTANGFVEIMSNSLTKLSYTTEPRDVVKILNPLSTDLEIMRQSLLFSGLEAVAYNQNRKNADLKLYEFGKTYRINAGQYEESQRLGIFMTGAKEVENWNNKTTPLSFYHLKSVVDIIIQRLGINHISTADLVNIHFLVGLNYSKNEKSLVHFGQVSGSILKELDITDKVFYADFNWDLIIETIRNNKITHREVAKYPAVRRDLSMLLNESIQFNDLKRIATQTEKTLLKDVNVFDVYAGDKLPKGKKSYALSFILQDEEKTLTERNIEATMQKLIHSFEKELGAEIRGK